MKETIKEVIKDLVENLLRVGGKTSMSKRDLKSLGIDTKKYNFNKNLKKVAHSKTGLKKVNGK